MNITNASTSQNGYSSMPIKSQSNQSLTDSTAPPKADNKQVLASSETQTNHTSYNLENITPQQTYKMAVDLMESKTIGFDSFVKLFRSILDQIALFL